MNITKEKRQELMKLAFSKSSRESLEIIIANSLEGSFNKIEAQKALDNKDKQ
jgi:hypothetical protein